MGGRGLARIEHEPVWRGLLRADLVDAADEAADLEPFGARRLVAGAYADARKQGEADAVDLVQRASLRVGEGRDDGNFGGGEFAQEILFILEGGAGPAAGAVEFRDEEATVLEADFIDAVDVGRQRAADTRGAAAGGALGAIHDGVGRERGEAAGSGRRDHAGS